MRSVVVVALLAVTSVSAQPQAPAQPPGCAPEGDIRFVCGQNGPEDLVAVPDSRWLVASAFGQQGGLFLIDTQAASSVQIFPDGAGADRPDTSTYADCPGPPSAAARANFRTHGLALEPGQGGLHTLYVVHHGSRESIEVFELDARAQPRLTWIGCAVAPDPIGLNSVAALPEGGFVSTNFDPRPPPGTQGPAFTQALLEGRNNGELWEWQPGAGWSVVPGSESAGANGIEVSADGRWLYVATWGNQSFYKLSRGQADIERQDIPLGFRVDNVRWAPDGQLLVAGQGEMTSVIGTIDPGTLTYRELIHHPTSPTISAATVAVQVGDEYWAGSFSGNRITVYPAAGPQ